jgi:hypothetical protein
MESKPVTHHEYRGVDDTTYHEAGKGPAGCPSCYPSRDIEQLIAKFVDDVTKLTGEVPGLTVKLPRGLYFGFLAEAMRGRPMDAEHFGGCDYSLGYTTVRIEPLPRSGR